MIFKDRQSQHMIRVILFAGFLIMISTAFLVEQYFFNIVHNLTGNCYTAGQNNTHFQW